MIQIASSQLGCSAGNVTCYCTQPDFGYGVRDCANEACQSGEAQTVISFGTSYCASALASYSQTASGASVTGSALSVLSSAGGSATGSAASASTTDSASGSASGSVTSTATVT